MCCPTCGCLGLCTDSLDHETARPRPSALDVENHNTVTDSARRGCKYCDLVSQAYALLGVPAAETPSLVIYINSDAPAQLTTDDGGPNDTVVEIFVSAGTPGVEVPLLGCEVPQRADSRASFKFLHDTYGACQEDHPKCRKDGTTLPSRVIDTSELPFKLVEPSPQTTAPYAALSYRWGGWQSFTTKDTFESLKKGIPMDLIPTLYQDFVQIAQQLGIHYIWIDSICIIQDDEADWKREAAKMADVFENASIVIAASAAPDPGHSILRGRLAPVDQSKILLLEGLQSSYRARRMVQCGYHATIASKHRDLLDDRGWALQEKELARRCMSYSVSELQWTCKTVHLCQCRAIPWASKPIDHATQGLSRNIQIQWQKKVQEFTHRKLTKIEDRLPALAGLARKFRSINHATYLAGLWKESLIEDLVWKRTSKTDFSLPPCRLGPTFSWASIPCGISYRAARWTYGGTRRYHCEVVRHDSKLEQDACINCDFVVLHGPCLDGELSCTDTNDGDAYSLCVEECTFRSGIFFDNRKSGHGCEFVLDCTLTIGDDSRNDVTARTPPLRAMSKPLPGSSFNNRPVKLLSLFSIVPEIGAAAYENFLILGYDTSARTYQRIGFGTGKIPILGETRHAMKKDEPFSWLFQGTTRVHTDSRYHCGEICIS